MRRILTASLLAFFAFIPVIASAQLPTYPFGQFGKNMVNWDEKDFHFYESYHFNVWHTLDLNNPDQRENFRQVIDSLEGAYAWMSSKEVFNHNIRKRIPIILFNTHNQLEANNLVGGFMPEGIGAFVESDRNRMFLKADFSRPLGRGISVHELVHEFQMDIMSMGLISKAIKSMPVPNGYIEGFAEYIASLYDPHTRDDIRRMNERVAASNPRSLPLWVQLRNDDPSVNGYTMWKMVFEFLEEEFGREVAVSFGTQPLAGAGLGTALYDLTQGVIGNPDANPEKFDQRARKYWGKRFQFDSINRPKPYEENENFRGRNITPSFNPYPSISPALSPDGKSFVAFTGFNGQLALCRFGIPAETPYVDKKTRDELARNAKKSTGDSGVQQLVNLTPQLPPVPWEYLIVQGFETWPFNGSDVSWSKTDDTIAFFARSGRDHTLFIVDSKKGKILKRIELNLDQAFSPAFSPDGKKLYFSAAENTIRNLYVIDLEKGASSIENLTKDSRFSTAPAISPDGNSLAYIALDGDYQHLFILDLANGSKRQLTFGRFNDNSPSWSDDGTTIVYTSDEQDQIWNLYTFDLAANTISQWTEFFGQALTPIFARGSRDLVYYVVFRDDDQFGPNLYENYELFEAKLLKPVRQRVSGNPQESVVYSFNAYRNLFKVELDSNQLLNPTKPPNSWKLMGASAQVGFGYWGAFGEGSFAVTNMLQTKTHFGQFAFAGNYIRLISYSYVNQEKRLGRRLSFYDIKIPMYYLFFDYSQNVQSYVLPFTILKSTGLDLKLSYPINKFNRVELFSSLKRREFDVSSPYIALAGFGGAFTKNDINLYNFFLDSSASSLSFGAAYVKDTVLYSDTTQGPFNGNAFRAEIEVAPPMGRNFIDFTSVTLDARTYRYLGFGTMVAGRATFASSNRANGNIVLFGSTQMLRGATYGGMIGNQVAYVSGEVRFPIINRIVLPGNFGVGPIRGLAFVDAGAVRFNDLDVSLKAGYSYGVGIQFLPFSVMWTKTGTSKQWRPSFYVTYNW